MAVAIGVGLVGRVLDGAPGRLPEAVQVAAAGAQDFSPRRATCLQIKPWDVDADKLCRLGPDDGMPPRFLVWGDSHADAMLPAFDLAATNAEVPGLIASYSACPPLLDVSIAIDPRDRCRQFNAAMLRAVSRHDIKTVVLAARWAVYIEGMLDGEGTQHPWLKPTPHASGGGEAAKALFKPSFERTLAALSEAGVAIWVIDPIPVPGRNVPRTLATAGMVGRDGAALLNRPLDAHVARNGWVLPVLADLEGAYGFRRFDPTAALCASSPEREGTNVCRVAAPDGTPWYYDDDHLSVTGAEYLAPNLGPMLAPNDLQAGPDAATPRG